MKIYFSQTFFIALNFFKDGLRSKAVIILISIFCVFFGFTSILSRMAVGDSSRVLLNGGFWIFGIMGVVSSVYFTSSIIKKEVEKKTLYMILSRSVSRFVFLSGCFLGTLLNILIIYSAGFLIWLLFLNLQGISISLSLIITCIFIFFEWILLCSMGIMFATFTSPLLNSFFVVFIYFTGHLSRSLYIYSGNVKDIIIKKILLIIYYIFPNLELLNFRVEALYSYSIPSSDIFSGILTFLSWTITAFLAGVLIFENKKLI